MGVKYGNGTFLAAEEHAYPRGGQTRPCRAECDDGKVRRVWAGIPDTFFSIPAHARIAGQYVAGFLMVDTTRDVLRFHAAPRKRAAPKETPDVGR